VGEVRHRPPPVVRADHHGTVLGRQLDQRVRHQPGVQHLLRAVLDAELRHLVGGELPPPTCAA
jgi:hypothetical protein